jgi:hypothetical protein
VAGSRPEGRRDGRRRGRPLDLLAGVDRVVVDGRNVQGALRRTVGDLPDAALVARLRAALVGFDVELILDGHPAGGPRGRIAPGFSVAYGRQRTADAIIADLVAEAARELGPAGADSIVVVTDDHEVRSHARRHGARVAGSAWLVERTERVEARGTAAPGAAPARRPGAALGHGRAPRTRRPR